MIQILQNKNNIRKIQLKVLVEKEETLRNQRTHIQESIGRTEEEIKKLENTPEKVGKPTQSEKPSKTIIPSEIPYWNGICETDQQKLLNHQITLDDISQSIKDLWSK